MSKTPRQDALQPPSPITKIDWWAMTGFVLVVLFGFAFLFFLTRPETGSYAIQCAVVTPNGPVQTVNLKAHDVIVTDFGIIKTKEGIYIPTTNEICVIKKETE